MRIIGIDNGNDGGIAFLDTTIQMYSAVIMPVYNVVSSGKNKKTLDGVTIRNILKEYNPELVVIEKAQTMPKQGISSAGNYMRSFGIIEGICIGLSLSYTLIPPQNWKRDLRLTKDKGYCIQRCLQLFPDIELIPKGCRKNHDGMAEAMLLAYWGSQFANR